MAESDGKAWKEIARQVLACIVVVSLVTAFFTAVEIAANRAVIRHVDPLNQRALTHLKNAAAEHPRDEELKDAYRDIDARARTQFYRAQTFERRGAFILAACVIVLLLSLHVLMRMSRRPPQPGQTGGEGDPTGVLIRRGVLAGVVTIGIFVVVLGWPGQRQLPPEETPTPQPPEQAENQQKEPPPPFDAFPKQWTAFRGSGGTGVSNAVNVPTAWNGAENQNIAWKTQPPKAGFSSPIIFEDKLYITGADKESRELYCYNSATGDLLWTARADNIVGSPAELPRVTEDTGYAAPTPTTNGDAVFAIFATGDIICVDSSGNRRWARNLGVPDNPYGHASSLYVHRDRLLVQYDHFESAQLIALDVHTGETIWEAERDVAASWASPLLTRVDDIVQVILNAEPFVEGFNAADGTKLWSCDCMGGEVGPSPAFIDGLAFATTDYVVLAAIHVAGEKAGTIAWETDEELPDVASPVAHDGLLFVPTSIGIISCYEAATGTLLWRQETPAMYYSSPIIADGNVYLTDRQGSTRIFKAARTYQPVAENALGESVVGTPAILDGRIYLRGVQHVYCIRQTEE